MLETQRRARGVLWVPCWGECGDVAGEQAGRVAGFINATTVMCCALEFGVRMPRDYSLFICELRSTRGLHTLTSAILHYVKEHAHLRVR